MICDVCPHYCELKHGDVGKCQVRQNIDGQIKLTQYGNVSSMAVEAIEKKPFFHFLPGSQFLTAGFHGCNFFCAFCQNFSVSQQVKEGKKVLPEDLCSIARDKQTNGIVFSYNEPTIYYEYILDTFQHLHGLKLALKTNGFVNQPILDQLCEGVNAFNVDIKGNEEDYQKICGGNLHSVLRSIETIFFLGKHLEISYFIPPARINDMSFHIRMRDFLSSLSPDVPVHLLYFYPFYQMGSEESYDVRLLVELAEAFREKIHYVYISNLHHKDVLRYRNTYCAKCKELMIDRTNGVDVIRLECCGKKICTF